MKTLDYASSHRCGNPIITYRHSPQPFVRKRPCFARLYLPVLLLLFVAACAPIPAFRGKAITQEQIIPLENASKQEVLNAIGAPTTKDAFNSQIWIYISAHNQKFAFYEVEVLERNVYRITFDKADQVTQIDHLSKDDGIPITLVQRETATHGRTLSPIEALIGDVGRFRPGVSR